MTVELHEPPRLAWRPDWIGLLVGDAPTTTIPGVGVVPLAPADALKLGREPEDRIEARGPLLGQATPTYWLREGAAASLRTLPSLVHGASRMLLRIATHPRGYSVAIPGAGCLRQLSPADVLYHTHKLLFDIYGHPIPTRITRWDWAVEPSPLDTPQAAVAALDAIKLAWPARSRRYLTRTDHLSDTGWTIYLEAPGLLVRAYRKYADPAPRFEVQFTRFHGCDFHEGLQETADRLHAFLCLLRAAAPSPLWPDPPDDDAWCGWSVPSGIGGSPEDWQIPLRKQALRWARSLATLLGRLNYDAEDGGAFTRALTQLRLDLGELPAVRSDEDASFSPRAIDHASGADLSEYLERCRNH